jgi:hypothetical protein
MSKRQSSLIIGLLAIIAGVMLFGADAVKNVLFYGGIIAAVTLLVRFIWSLFELPSSKNDEPVFALIPILISFGIAFVVLLWATYIAFHDGIRLSVALDQFQTPLFIFGGLFLIGMLLAAIETRRKWVPEVIPTIKGYLLKWWYLLIGPLFVIKGVRLSLAERRANGEAISFAAAASTMLFSIFLSLFLSALAMLAVLVVGVILFSWIY